MFVADRPDPYVHGIWFHRIRNPGEALMRRGHAVKTICIGNEISEAFLEWPDVVVFGRTYPNELNPIKWMKEFKKRGKRVIYDMDDDFWEVAKSNPSKFVSNALKDQYEGMIKEADAIITPSDVLAKKFKKFFKKKIFICPNGVDVMSIRTDGVAIPGAYTERPHNPKALTIGYMGAASHWKDLQLIGEVLTDLSSKHDFTFSIYGLEGQPLESAMYYYQRTLQNNFAPEKNDYFRSALAFAKQIEDMRVMHIPFMPPDLHPSVLSRCDFDIGLAPLEDTVFNRGKSCIKYYEYAAVGTCVLASDVLPYNQEVSYLAKNTKKDWSKKLEKLIVDEKFRKELTEKQQAWVKKNRSLEAIGLPWELALQGEGIKGLTVANQRE
jgi:glycosyltransferase involved in cell wall biosynthesis